MEKKRAQMDRLDASRPEVKEQLYRYHANLGTFLMLQGIPYDSDKGRAVCGAVSAILTGESPGPCVRR